MKQYQKPEVFYENFVLADHIAQCANVGYNYIAACTVTDDCEIVKDGIVAWFFWRLDERIRQR